MKQQPGTNVSVESVGALVEVAVGPSAVKMTPDEAEEMIAAMQHAVDEARTITRHPERIH